MMKKVTMLFISASIMSQVRKLESSILDKFWDIVKDKTNPIKFDSVYKSYPKGNDTNGFYAVESKESTKFFKEWSECFNETIKPEKAPKNAPTDAFAIQLEVLQSLPKTAAITKKIEAIKVLMS